MSQNYDFLRTFTFDGNETNHLFQIAKLNIPFLSKENEFFQVGNTDGKKFRNTRLGDYTLSIDGFVIKDNTGKSVSDSLDELKVLLHSDEPKQLVFDIFPDRYFNAIFTGVQEYDATNLDYTPLTLVFDVPDALAHQINPSGFSNAINDTLNLVLDSEFNTTIKYMAPWVLKLDEQYAGSNIVRADFSNGTPLDEPVRNDHWLYKTWTLNRKPVGLKVGDKVAISAHIRLNSVSETNVYAGSVVLEEFTDGKKNNTNHFIRLPNATTTDFVQYSGVFEINNPETNGIALSVGVYGEGTSLDLTKPLMALSETVPTYVASSESYGDVINVINNGTYKAYPQFEFTMNGENGLVAVLNENGNVLQFGNPEDVDGTVATRLDMGLKESFWGKTMPSELIVNTGFDSVVPNFNNNPATPNLVDGSFDMETYVDAIRPLFPQISQEVWHGPTMILPITAPTNNDRTGSFGAHTRFYFRNINKGERGRLEFAVNDETGANAMTFIVRDSSIANTEIVLEMWYKKKKLNQVSLDRKVFKKDFFEINMERFGNTLTWRFVQINSLNKYENVVVDKQYKFTWELEEKDTTKFTTTGVWFMRYGNTPHNPMYVTDMQAKWYNTPFFNNVKNIFQDGDNVTIDVQERSIYINGTINNELNIVGNEWEQFRLGLGSTVIQPVVSSWAEPANVNVSLRQSYL